jgi:proton-translocating NADH-quinone oxidoreductase chain L
MHLLILFFPLINFILLISLGRYFKRSGSVVLTFFNMGLASLVSIYCFFSLIYWEKTVVIYWLARWFAVDTLVVHWGFLFDSLSLIMCFIVTFISLLVHMYSMEYMAHDPNLIKFLSFLSLFTFFMLLMVTGDNFIQLFFGWEGVGLSSYLLINFWYTRLQANKAAVKAILVNRIGDFGLLIGILLIFYVFKSINFAVVFTLVPWFKADLIELFGFKLNAITVICSFLFVGVMGKSAQFILHTWLPDAMEGPTPVSALIHAATMVTAGIFVLVRCSHLFEYSPTVLVFLLFIGGFTSLFGSFVGLFQNDLKKVIAYSTCSQLGYMLFACGVSNYMGSMLHLVNHAFFKALLFLSAGAIIHALSDEQDMRRMGGLVKLLPFTYVMFLTGSLALMGFPFFTGYYSKDLVLELTYSSFTLSSYFVVWLGTIAAFFTSVYSFRVMYLVFLSKPRFYKVYLNSIHDAPFKMGLALFILWIGSIFVGYFIQEWFIGPGHFFWSNSILMRDSRASAMVEFEYLPFYIKIMPILFSCTGLILGYYFEKFFNKYLLNSFDKYLLKNEFIGIKLLKYFKVKWAFDEIYNTYIVRNLTWFGYHVSFKFIDRGLIELIGPLGAVRFGHYLSRLVSLFQTGKIYHYIFVIIVGSIFMVAFVVFDFLGFFNFDGLLYFILIYFVILQASDYSSIESDNK